MNPDLEQPQPNAPDQQASEQPQPNAPDQQASEQPSAAAPTPDTPTPSTSTTPDTTSEQEAPAVTHTQPTLTYGAAGPAVKELADLLAAAGFADNTISRGENPAYLLDNSVMADVKRFCGEHDVQNDIGEYQGKEVPAQQLVGEHVGPSIWQALYDHAAKVS